MNFRLKTGKAGFRGLNMGLCPGMYEGARSTEASVNVAESAFGFLEPAIKRHCPKYANYGHYGVTVISREQWSSIMEDWESLREKVQASQGLEILGYLLFLDKYAKKEFTADIETNRDGLANMIAQLNDWLRKTLETHPVVSILGI
jgi:hypothetical protein